MLDDVLRAHARLRRVLARRAQRPPAAQQVPELVEPHLQCPQLGLLLLAEPPALGVAAQLVLARDQRLDVVLDGLVGIGLARRSA